MIESMEIQDIIKTAIGASIPILIFYLGYLIKRRQDKIEGKHRNRIQFELEATSFGPQKGHYITAIKILMQNQGLVRKEINELQLSIRGIEKNKEIGLFKKEDQKPKEIKKKSIVDSSNKLVNTKLLASNSNKNDNMDKKTKKESVANFPIKLVNTNVLTRKSNKKENAEKETKKKSIADFLIKLVKTKLLAKKVSENEKKKDKSKKTKKKKEVWFIEPGVAQKFTYVARIPENIRFVLVGSSFEYRKGLDHTAQKVFEIKTQ